MPKTGQGMPQKAGKLGWHQLYRGGFRARYFLKDELKTSLNLLLHTSVGLAPPDSANNLPGRTEG